LLCRDLSREGLLVVCASELAQLYTTIAADKVSAMQLCYQTSLTQSLSETA